MAIPRPKKKDYKICEFCKLYPCMYVTNDEVEYRTHCRSYSADSRKIKNDKMTKRTYACLPN